MDLRGSGAGWAGSITRVLHLAVWTWLYKLSHLRHMVLAYAAEWKCIVCYQKRKKILFKKLQME